MTTLYTLLLMVCLHAHYATALPPNINNDALEAQRKKIEDAKKDAAIRGRRVSPNSGLYYAYKLLLPITLPFFLFSILIGHMLGDCSVTASKTKFEASLSFEWGNQAYAEYVYSLLREYVISAIRVQTRINENGNEVTTYCFRTLTLPCFAIFVRLFIVDGVKTVPAGLVFMFVNPLALATWYMDDGGLASYKPGHGTIVQLHTQGFSPEVVQRMAKELNARYGFGCQQKWNKGKPIISLPSSSYPAFRRVVAPYIHSSMAYKLPPVRLDGEFLDPACWHSHSHKHSFNYISREP